jgi:hypothetical protein
MREEDHRGPRCIDSNTSQNLGRSTDLPFISKLDRYCLYKNTGRIGLFVVIVWRRK